ncbi:MAG: sigma 54-interacting transcriptional regulator [Thermoplasmata archaeon]
MASRATAPDAEPAVGTRSTAAELQRLGVRFAGPAERLRERLIAALRAAQGPDRAEAMRGLFRHTVLPAPAYDDLIAALLAGSHVLLFGPSGAGKTSLAKDIWELFPREVWAVDGCPVLDDPLTLVDPAAAARSPPCPICRRRFAGAGGDGAFDPRRVDARSVPAERVRLREGYGFARLQGSSEVFPDHLTGNINLRRLEEVGDPMSPLVLEPGKLLQANRGLLLVDEIGKLPLGTQNVLLQALQEGTVTPAKTRESFPAEFVAICTSNLSDLDNINDPLSDRLTSLHIGYNPRHADNRRIVAVAQGPLTGPAVPEILLDAGIRVIEAWRRKNADDNPDIGEVGSNRTLLDVAARTSAIALLHGRARATEEDLRAGLLHAMRGRIRARSGEAFQQNERRVQEFVEANAEPALRRSAGVYWCRYFRGPLGESRPRGEAIVAEGRRLASDPGLAADAEGNAALFPEFRRFAAWVAETEGVPAGTPTFPAALAAFALLERYSLFACPEDADDDAPLP